jgi:hypothetical protein
MIFKAHHLREADNNTFLELCKIIAELKLFKLQLFQYWKHWKWGYNKNIFNYDTKKFHDKLGFAQVSRIDLTENCGSKTWTNRLGASSLCINQRVL